MSNILIVGNVLKDVYLRLDERKNNFEIDEKGTPWLDLAFDGRSTAKFFRRTAIFGGASIALEVMNRFDHDAHIAGARIGFVDNEIIANDQEINEYRYMLCRGNKITYLTGDARAETKWVNPTDTVVDWIYVDRSAGVTDELVKDLRQFLSMSSRTRVAVYVPRNPSEADKKLLAFASMIFVDENDKPGASSANPTAANLNGLTDANYSGSICRISDKGITLGNVHQNWRIERTDLMTHLTCHSIIAATVFSALLLGKSVKDALALAKANVENSTLAATLPLAKAQSIADNSRSEENDITLVAAQMMTAGKGILAADESGGNIHKQFEALLIPDDEEHRRDYRNLFLSTPELEQFVNAVILFDETTHQKSDDGRDFVSFLTAHGIIPGVKVDAGLKDLPGSSEKYTDGLDGLKRRLDDYYDAGLRFAKWRAVFEIGNGKPSEDAIQKNVDILAAYAKTCQDASIVPIVEPEVLYDGNYTLEMCIETTAKVLDYLFDALAKNGVKPEATILKVNMIQAGKQYPIQSTKEEIGKATGDTLRAHVPRRLAGIVFLSGGQTPEQATDNLREIMKNGPYPWPVTFSFARALQQPALLAWRGDNANADAAKAAFKDRLIANCSALKG